MFDDGRIVAEIRFCTAPDGARLAYAVHGHGPPLVRVATWRLISSWIGQARCGAIGLIGSATSHRGLRYDERGCGLSGPGAGDLSVETWVGDLEAVIDAAGVERFALLGVSQGAAIAEHTPRDTPRGYRISCCMAATRGAGGCVGRGRRRGADCGDPRWLGER